MIEFHPPITRHGSHVTALKYDAANEQIRFNSATTNLVYDSNGNLTSFTDGSGTTTYTWNARNQLTTISGPGLSANFVYDGLGRRATKTVNSATTGYWYDGDDVLAELSGGSPTATYVRSLAIDEAFIRKGASDEFYQTDALGSMLALTTLMGQPRPRIPTNHSERRLSPVQAPILSNTPDVRTMAQGCITIEQGITAPSSAGSCAKTRWVFSLVVLICTSM